MNTQESGFGGLLTVRAGWMVRMAALSGLLWGLAHPPNLPGAETAARAPRNVLFLMTDEQHHRSLSLTGNPYITTPNMDRLGREGALFLRATCVTPYCSPSRASLITGVYPFRHGILRNVDGKGTQAPLAPEAFPNTENLLHQAGYVTAHFGKWHLGNPGDFGCYESRVYAGKTPREYMDFLDGALPASRFQGHPSPGKYLNRPVEMIPAMEKAYRAFAAESKNRLAYIGIIGRTVIPPEFLPETRITDAAIRCLEEHAKERFMMTVSWSPPHDLWVIPEPYYSLVDRGRIALSGSRALPAWDEAGPSRRLGELAGEEGIREYAAIYHGMVKYVDDQIGRILQKLDELGLTDETLIVFTSDHGDMVGAHGCIGKSITSFYDDLVRIPLLLRLPGVIPSGARVNQFVSQVDLMPTILDYLGQPIPEALHGKSLRGLVEGRETSWRDFAFCQRAGKCFMVQHGRFKYVYGARPPVMALYDLETDPDEDHNLANEPRQAAVVREMHRRLLGVLREGGATLDPPLPEDPLALALAPGKPGGAKPALPVRP